MAAVTQFFSNRLSDEESTCHPGSVGRRGLLIGRRNRKDETGLPSLFFVPMVTKFSALWKMYEINVEWAAEDVC